MFSANRAVPSRIKPMQCYWCSATYSQCSPRPVWQQFLSHPAPHWLPTPPPQKVLNCPIVLAIGLSAITIANTFYFSIASVRPVFVPIGMCRPVRNVPISRPSSQVRSRPNEFSTYSLCGSVCEVLLPRMVAFVASVPLALYF